MFDNYWFPKVLFKMAFNFKSNSILISVFCVLFSAVITVSGSTAPSSSCVCGVVNPHMWLGDAGTSSPLYYPWAVSITDAAGNSFCGGVLINDNELLTAAHCLTGHTKDTVGLILGVHDISQAVARDKYRVKSFLIHPEFKKSQDNTFDNDLAIITMEKSLNYRTQTENIRPICIPKSRVEIISNKTEVIVLGWGQLSADEANTAQKLQMLERPTIPIQDCQKSWNKAFVQGQKICMGKDGHNICKGDEGGPLMLENKPGHFVLIGIASYSGPVCGDEKPGVYSDFEFYREWITKNSHASPCSSQ